MNNVLDVSKYILHVANTNGDSITNLKLQKLLYYAQAWYLVNHEKPLFDEPIEAWQYGPVVGPAYREFKNFGNRPIDKDYSDSDFSNLTSNHKQYLSDFCQNFLKYSATELVGMTHAEDPWKNAYNKKEGDLISIDEMKDFYTKMLDKK